MTYRGQVKNGVVVLEGSHLPEGTEVEVVPLKDRGSSLANHPAFGMWKDRTDIADSAEYSLKLRRRVETGQDHGSNDH